nr:hypothetical protein [Phycisphaerae bacterium]
MDTGSAVVNRERQVKVHNGWTLLPVALLLGLGSPALFIYSIGAGRGGTGEPLWGLFILALVMGFLGILMLPGFFTLQPNEARVLILFGEYKGTV